MKILVTGALGQIGSELIDTLTDRYASENVFATDKKTNNQNFDCKFEKLDVLNYESIENIVTENNIDTIYHLAAILSAVAEEKPRLAWQVNMEGLKNVLEVAAKHDCAVFTPSSIGAFGPNTPKNKTPQDTIQRPTSMYGVTKVSGELLCDYYHTKFGVDTRGLRYPGIISNKTLPGGGTTDYAVEIYYEALKNGHYECFLEQDTQLDMMYMPDAIKAAIELMETPADKLTHRNAFNVTSMSVAPRDFANSIKEYLPDFTVEYKVDQTKQKIANSWPNSLDDSAATKEWGWEAEYDLDSMTKDMLDKLSVKLGIDFKIKE
ncbi:MAG: L-threonine 3-dehydrogenase [Candidatus Marinimicrobia bacterium]|nr:L-threonine 3-dehydrogenase [Candidatus Neomarinimicrobiota bacterium]